MKVQYLVASMMLFYIIRLVEKINVSIGQDHNSRYLIGVLDIYGFESFKTNSFEQFCINYTNEKLQQHFNQHVFKTEQEEYSREQIDWSYIEFIDNKDVLDLIEKKPGGIIALLDEACTFPKSTHETFSQKLYQTFRSHQRFFKPKLSRTGFTIAHYAGEIRGAISALRYHEQFPRLPGDFEVPVHRNLDMFDLLEFVFGFQKDNIRNQPENIVFSIANAQSRLGIPVESDPFTSH